MQLLKLHSSALIDKMMIYRLIHDNILSLLSLLFHHVCIVFPISVFLLLEYSFEI